MKRTKRVAGMITAALIMTSFLVIGCGDSPTGPLVAGDDDGTIVKPGNTGADYDKNLRGTGSNNQK